MTDEEFLAEVECQIPIAKRQMEIDNEAYISAGRIWKRSADIYQALITIKNHLEIDIKGMSRLP